jgi:hypothetical protein
VLLCEVIARSYVFSRKLMIATLSTKYVEKPGNKSAGNCAILI